MVFRWLSVPNPGNLPFKKDAKAQGIAREGGGHIYSLFLQGTRHVISYP